MNIIWYIGIGGFLGAVSRFGLSNLLSVGQSGFFWATFVTNIIGSFLLGFVLALVLGKLLVSEKIKTMLTTGFISSFTTFSTYSNEILSLLKIGKLVTALVYLMSNFIFGILLCWLGVLVGKRLITWQHVKPEEIIR